MLNTLTSLLLPASSAATTEPSGATSDQAPSVEPNGQHLEMVGDAPKDKISDDEFTLVSRRIAPEGEHIKSKSGLTVEEGWVLVEQEDSASEAGLSDFSFPHSVEQSGHSTPASGWNLTPPACFNPGMAPSPVGGVAVTSTTYSVLETSNFENLLIEHPTMSVYGPPRGQENANNNTTTTNQDDDEPVIPRHPREIRLAEFLPPDLFDQTVRQQKAAARQASRSLTPHKVDRSNRTVRYESCGRRNYRKKRMRSLNVGVSDRKSH